MTDRPDLSTTRPELPPRRALVYSRTPIDLEELATKVPIVVEDIDVIHDSKEAKAAIDSGRYTCVIVNKTSLDPSSYRVSQYATVFENVACRLFIEMNVLPSLTVDYWTLGGDQLFHHSGQVRHALTVPVKALFQLSGIKWVNDVRKQFEYQRKTLENVEKKVVLVVGAEGTAKLPLAQISHSRSHRRDNPFIYANCNTLEEKLYTSWVTDSARDYFKTNIEFMLKQAQGGTVYFHEIDKLDRAAFEVLTEVVKKGTFVNDDEEIESFKGAIIFSSLTSLEEKCKNGEVPRQFLKLFAGHVIRVPSLIDYPEDIPAMADSMIKSICAIEKIEAKRLNEAAIKTLQAQVLNANLRELYYLLSHSIFRLRTRKIIRPEDLYFGTHVGADDLQDVRTEKERIEDALKDSNGDKSKAAAILKIARKTLYVYMDKYDIPRDFGQSGVKR